MDFGGISNLYLFISCIIYFLFYFIIIIFLRFILNQFHIHLRHPWLKKYSKVALFLEILISEYSEILEIFLVVYIYIYFKAYFYFRYIINKVFIFDILCPGVDFAWSTNGYVYHTKFDTVDQIPLGSLQRTGDNILALAQGIMLEDFMSDRTSQNAVENLVFFDFLGAFVIRWPLYVSSIINVLSISIGIYSVYMNMQNARRGKYEY